MLVGILCECSGVVRDAFIRAGHYAVSCDLKDTRAPGPHIKGDCLTQDWRGFDLLIMHPTCTYLCSSGLHWNKRTPGRAQKTEEALEFVRRLMEIGEEVGRYALENPKGCISTRIRPPDQYVQPWQFGDDASKETGLWLHNLPLLTHTHTHAPRIVIDAKGKPRKRWGNQTDSGQNKLGPSEDRAELRSNTYKGIAEAMAQQWGILR